ncbi:MAG: flavin reductase [Firmicutes bacterium]|nr:flavin reductase [Bacillota bacterium]
MNEALFKIGYGLYVLSAHEGGKDNACIANTFIQVTSAEPFVCLITVNKQTLTHDMIKNTGKFNLSVLTENAPFDIYKRFGYQSGKKADKFSGIKSVARSKNGLLYLTENTNAFLSCTVTGAADYGTHTLFTAQLTESAVLSDAESVTYAYYQRHIKPKPAAAAKKGYRCVICNYIYEGEPLPPDYICPICKHGAADFVKL